MPKPCPSHGINKAGVEVACVLSPGHYDFHRDEHWFVWTDKQQVDKPK